MKRFMTKGILQFILGAFLHTMLFIFSLRAGLVFIPPLSSELYEIVYLSQLYFHLLYFIFCYFILYRQDVSFFRRQALNIISSSLLLATALVLTVIFIVIYLIYPLTGLFTIWACSSPLILQALCILLLFNWGLAYLWLAMQYLWLYHLHQLGYLEKRVLFIGQLEYHLPLHLIKTDKLCQCTGLIIKRGSYFIFNSQDGLERPIKPSQIKSLILKQHITDVIISNTPTISNSFRNSLVKWLGEKRINYYLVPDLSHLPQAPYVPASFPYLPYLVKGIGVVTSVTLLTYKRLLDLALVILTSFFTLPLGLLIALFIKLKDRGPVLYIQQRVGLNGRIINFLKFRTMVVNAERLLPSLLAYNARPDGPLFKMEKDPRLTPWGRLLRAFALDELPQLLNVLKGELSLIGPRPHLITETAYYPPEAFLRLSCVPGIICLPQLVDKGRLGFQQWLKLDLYYRQNWSLALDLKIIKESAKLILKPFLKLLQVRP